MTNCADHLAVVTDIIHYLHDQGVVRDPMYGQTVPDTLPAVWAGQLHPDVGHAVAVVGPWQDGTDSDTNPLVRFMVVTRSKPDDLTSLLDTTQKVYKALHRPHDAFPLTARQSVMFCRRIVADPPVPDENRRYVRVETYQARLHPPTPQTP